MRLISLVTFSRRAANAEPHHSHGLVSSDAFNLRSHTGVSSTSRCAEPPSRNKRLCCSSRWLSRQLRRRLASDLLFGNDTCGCGRSRTEFVVDSHVAILWRRLAHVVDSLQPWLTRCFGRSNKKSPLDSTPLCPSHCSERQAASAAALLETQPLEFLNALQCSQRSCPVLSFECPLLNALFSVPFWLSVHLSTAISNRVER